MDLSWVMMKESMLELVSSRLICAGVFFSLVAGCAALPPEKELTFNAVILNNKSDADLENVRVEVKKTKAYLFCSIIVRESFCSTSFPPKNYDGNSVYVSWQQNGAAHIVGPLYVQAPSVIYTGTSASVIIDFSSKNNISVRFIY